MTNERIQTSSSTAARTVNAVGNLNFLFGAAGSAGAGSGGVASRGGPSTVVTSGLPPRGLARCGEQREPEVRHALEQPLQLRLVADRPLEDGVLVLAPERHPLEGLPGTVAEVPRHDEPVLAGRHRQTIAPGRVADEDPRKIHPGDCTPRRPSAVARVTASDRDLTAS